MRADEFGQLATYRAHAETRKTRIAAREIAVSVEIDIRQVNVRPGLLIQVTRQAHLTGRKTGLHLVRGAAFDEAVPGDRPVEDRRRVEGVDVIEGEADVLAHQAVREQPAR